MDNVSSNHRFWGVTLIVLCMYAGGSERPVFVLSHLLAFVTGLLVGRAEPRPTKARP